MDPFEEIYHRYGDSVFRFTCRLVGQRAVAEDITADVFLTLYERIDDIDVAQLPGWLFTVARHRAMDYWRRAAVERRYLSALVVPESQPSPDATSADGTSPARTTADGGSTASGATPASGQSPPNRGKRKRR